MSFPSALPTSRIADPRSAPSLRWGILGPGWIADNFVGPLQRNTTQQVVAVGSRSADTACAWSAERSIPRAYGSYEELVNDPDVDVVYVATPHNFHVEHGLLAISAGKHVLIEKPIALSSRDLEELFAAARQAGVMCQEAFWTFFLPKFDVIRQLLDDDVLGDLVSVLADHGEWLPPDHRIHDPALAGGSLHDLGVYVFAMSAWALGRPSTVRATGRMTDRGVMGDVAVAMQSAGGAISSLTTTMMTNTPTTATLGGSKASLHIDSGFFLPGAFTLKENATGAMLRYDEPTVRHQALFFEAAEMARCIAEGRTTSNYWTPDDSRDVTAILDAVNDELGI